MESQSSMPSQEYQNKNPEEISVWTSVGSCSCIFEQSGQIPPRVLLKDFPGKNKTKQNKTKQNKQNKTKQKLMLCSFFVFVVKGVSHVKIYFKSFLKSDIGLLESILKIRRIHCDIDSFPKMSRAKDSHSLW